MSKNRVYLIVLVAVLLGISVLAFKVQKARGEFIAKRIQAHSH
ncbi:MAG: hypothetical protein OEY22_09885 [Candidatus Bathyarchaeota archaeon]|nr:hypothetical protein [Candidatus Bathyarchaeota archaeon]MDH5787484.1 hypothetical protein [Candidatus Bathyarchaeota archaeon]